MPRFELVTGPTLEPVTLAEAKNHLRYVDNDEDPLINALITSARLTVESQTARQLVTATWKLHLDFFPAGDIEIRKPPVASISSITYFDTQGDQQTWDASKYETDLVSEPARIRPAHNETYPSTRWHKLNAVTIEFVAGKAVDDVDQRAKQAILLLVAHAFENREAVSGRVMHDVPFAAACLIDSLRWTHYAGIF